MTTEVQELFGSEVDFVEVLRPFVEAAYAKAYGRDASTAKAAVAGLTMTVSRVLDTHGYETSKIFQLRNGNNSIIQFHVNPYPTCCALTTFHGFYVGSYCPQEVVDLFMDFVFKTNLDSRRLWSFGASRRLVVAMVEQDYRDGIAKDSTAEIEDDGKPLQYQLIKNWFDKQRQCKTVNRMYNANSGKIVHLLNVVV